MIKVQKKEKFSVFEFLFLIVSDFVLRASDFRAMHGTLSFGTTLSPDYLRREISG